ncbi:Phytoene dehydrogenase-related protein [Butyrivibrio sp. YAB3001]|nr:Phytoene dehydrogenase-related protein [Butyrivibrio sp. YAB3001]
MTCACALANKGYEVRVFEKQPVLGGYCQNFKRKGFTFGAAIHRVGGIYGRDNVNCILKEVGVTQLPEWYSFREKVQVGDRVINMCNSNVAESLKTIFPEESENIQRFWDEVMKINDLLTTIDEGANEGIARFEPKDLELLKKYRTVSIDEFLSEFFVNEEIKGILVAVSDAMPGGAVFAFVRMVAFANCSELTYQPVGGASAIIKALADRIVELGGEILLNSPVEKIIMEDGQAKGVICKGKEYYSDYIITNCDMNTTLYNLVGEEYLNPRLVKKVREKFTESPSCFSVWLGLDKDVKELGYEPGNLTYYPEKDSVLSDKAKLIADGSVQRDNDFVLISLSANNDPKSSPEGKGQIMIGMMCNYDFENLAELRKTNMQEYRKRKTEVAHRLVKKVEKFFPGLSDHIEVMETASPATFERYTGNSKGAYGGYKCTPDLVENYSAIDGKQLVKNLFATGHWGGVGDGVIFTTDMAMRVADKVLTCDMRKDLYDYNKKIS